MKCIVGKDCKDQEKPSVPDDRGSTYRCHM